MQDKFTGFCENVHRSKVDLTFIFEKLSAKTGVIFAHDLRKFHFNLERPFKEFDIPKLQPTLKILDIVNVSEIVMFFDEAMNFSDLKVYKFLFITLFNKHVSQYFNKLGACILSNFCGKSGFCFYFNENKDNYASLLL